MKITLLNIKIAPLIQNQYASLVWVELGAPLLLQMNPDVTAFPKRIFSIDQNFRTKRENHLVFGDFNKWYWWKYLNKNNFYTKFKKGHQINNQRKPKFFVEARIVPLDFSFWPKWREPSGFQNTSSKLDLSKNGFLCY